MKKIAGLLALIIFISINSEAQQREIALKEYFADAEFFLAQEFYTDALHDYLEVYNRGYQENPNINYRIGICYLNIPGQKDKSIDYLLNAVPEVSLKYKESTLKEKSSPIDAYLYLGNAYRINNQLDKAIEAYNKYKELLPLGNEELRQYAQQQIEACHVASQYMDNPVPVKEINLNEPINGSSANFKAVVSGDGSTIVYMNKLPFYDAIYYSTKKDDGNWSSPRNITPEVMSDGNQYVCDLSYNGKKLILTKEDDFNSDIYVSYLENGRWKKSEPVSGKINTRFWESHASLSKDGRTLYFASNKNGGVGATDIYMSKLDENNEWGEPVNLGKVVNTPLNEDTPFITDNGELLFFSSQGHKGMGGYDIFVTRLGDDNKWTEPENLKYPINTTDDDLFYYMAIWNDEGLGDFDIYEIESDIPAVNEVLMTTEKMKEIEKEADATITEEVTEEVEQEKEELTETVVQETEAQVEQPVTKDTETIEEAGETKIVELVPILFAFDSYALTEKGKKTLDDLVVVLNENKNISLKLIGHTDAIGSESYNNKLSEKRAVAAMQYLISKGISAQRLNAVGMGEKEFIAINKNSDGSDNSNGRKYNRRVEFEIKGVDESVLIIKRINPVPENLKKK
jgi:outer membrane protein OmpA-like peptidoglycan-associated protein/tetratricopeptide (TPR) repeat protein